MCLSSVRNESHSFGKRIKFEGSSPPSFQAASHVPKKITTKPSFSTKIRFTTSNTPPHVLLWCVITILNKNLGLQSKTQHQNLSSFPLFSSFPTNVFDVSRPFLIQDFPKLSIATFFMLNNRYSDFCFSL